MQFSLTPTRITKEKLLSEHSEEEYMSFYLGIIPDKDIHTNPLRADRKPTATFYRSKKGELIFKDWKTNQHYNFIDVVMHKFGAAYGRAISIIANDFNILTLSKAEKNTAAITYTGEVLNDKVGSTINAEIQDFSAKELAWWEAFGVRKEELDKYGVYSVKNVFLNGNLLNSSSEASPIFGYYFGKEEGRELWKMYYPIKKKFRFMLNTNKLQGVKQLPKTGDILVVTKSMKDVMVLNRMGVAAIAPQAESIIITARQYEALSKRFDRIIFNGDWDGAGQKFMFDSRRKYKGIALSFRDKCKHAKDISDFVKKYGFERAQSFVYKVRDAVLSGKFDRQFKYCKAA